MSNVHTHADCTFVSLAVFPVVVRGVGSVHTIIEILATAYPTRLHVETFLLVELAQRRIVCQNCNILQVWAWGRGGGENDFTYKNNRQEQKITVQNSKQNILSVSQVLYIDVSRLDLVSHDNHMTVT